MCCLIWTKDCWWLFALILRPWKNNVYLERLIEEIKSRKRKRCQVIRFKSAAGVALCTAALFSQSVFGRGRMLIHGYEMHGFKEQRALKSPSKSWAGPVWNWVNSAGFQHCQKGSSPFKGVILFQIKQPWYFVQIPSSCLLSASTIWHLPALLKPHHGTVLIKREESGSDEIRGKVIFIIWEIRFETVSAHPPFATQEQTPSSLPACAKIYCL